MSTRRSLTALMTAALVAVLAGCGGSGGQSTAQTQEPFAYDTAQPLGFQDHGRANKNYPIAIHDVSYMSGKDRVPAYLLLPPAAGKKKRPAVIYLHGSNGDRTTMVVPATWMAGRGAVGLTITAPSSTAPTTKASPTALLRRDVGFEERDVVAVRRAIDLLRKRPDVDPNRIGFVGWSAGARTGGILAGVEPRFKTLVLMSGGAVPVQAYTRGLRSKKLKNAIAHYLTIVDPLRYLRQGRGSALLLQDGRDDQDVPRTALANFASAAPVGATIRWYSADHQLNDAAYRDQLAWLAKKLGVTGPPVQGALTGPPS